MAKGAVAEAITKAPQLKGRHADFMKKHLTIGIAFSVSMMALAYFTVNQPRKKAYAEYYKYATQITALFLFCFIVHLVESYKMCIFWFFFFFFLISTETTILKQISTELEMLAGSNHAAQIRFQSLIVKWNSWIFISITIWISWIAQIKNCFEENLLTSSITLL